MKKKLYVPFNAYGDMQSFAYYVLDENEEKECEEKGYIDLTYPNGGFCARVKPNYEFQEKMRFDRFGRGCSSAKAFFIGVESGREFEMFLKDLSDVIKGNNIANGIVEGTFTYCKRGQNYGVMLLKGTNNESKIKNNF